VSTDPYGLDDGKFPQPNAKTGEGAGGGGC